MEHGHDHGTVLADETTEGGDERSRFASDLVGRSVRGDGQPVGVVEFVSDSLLDLLVGGRGADDLSDLRLDLVVRETGPVFVLLEQAPHGNLRGGRSRFRDHERYHKTGRLSMKAMCGIVEVTYMSTQIVKTVTVSLPGKLTHAVDLLSKKTDQSRSELISIAVREFLLDVKEDREHFLEAFKKTRREKVFSMSELRQKYDLV